MCGITGFLCTEKNEKEETALREMNRQIAARGPDDEGYYLGKGIALAMLVTYTEQDVVAPYYAEVSELDDIAKMQYIDINFWMRGDILRKSDHISMAHGLEVRVPYLDAAVAGAVFSVPTRHQVTRKQTKALFRRVSDKYLPRETADRRKLGFPVPLRHWLKKEPYEGIVREAFESAAAQKFFEKSILLELMEQHRNGKKDNSRKIWTAYLFLRWYRQNF